MNTLNQVIKKAAVRRRARSRDIRKEIDRLREAITRKSGNWNGTKIIRDIRDGR